MKMLRRIISYLGYMFFFRCTDYSCSMFAAIVTLVLFFNVSVCALLVSLLLALLIVSFLINLFYPGSVAIMIPHQCRFIAAREATLQCRIENKSNRVIRDLSLRFSGLPKNVRQLESEFIPMLSPGQSTECKVKLCFYKRGKYTLSGLMCCTTFPFKMFRAPKGKANSFTAVIYPDFTIVSGLDKKNAISSGFHNISPLYGCGNSEEYLSTRVSFKIESPRHVDARAWARLNVPAVREYHRRNENNVGMYMQTFMPDCQKRTKEAKAVFEAAVELMASCVYTLYASGYKLNFLGSCETSCKFGPSTADSFDRIMEVLAQIKPVADRVTLCDRLAMKKVKDRPIIVFVIHDPENMPTDIICDSLAKGCFTRIIYIDHGQHKITYRKYPNAATSVISIKDIYNESIILN
jgi:uncharacterized protein (DUF58 family)